MPKTFFLALILPFFRHYVSLKRYNLSYSKRMNLDLKTRNGFLALTAVLIVIAGGLFYYFKPHTTEPSVHYHAGFQVYVDDKLQNFSDLRYMNVSPCGGVFQRENDQLEKAHLHDGVGDVVHVHRSGAVWGDLFKNIGFQMPTSSEFVGYLNGNRQENLLNYPILAYDSVVFFEGPIVDMNKKLQARVTDDHIKEVESRSEDCGKK